MHAERHSGNQNQVVMLAMFSLLASSWPWQMSYWRWSEYPMVNAKWQMVNAK